MSRIKDPKEVRVYEFDGVSQSAVYAGPLVALTRVNDELKWREEDSGCFEPLKVLTLDEIFQQLKDKYIIITVIVEGALAGEIYQVGNYADGRWYRIGDTIGYA